MFCTIFNFQTRSRADEQKIVVAVYLLECRLLLPFQHPLKGFLCFLAHRHVAETALCLWLCYVETVLVPK